MKKKSVSLLLAGMMALSAIMAGCGAKDEGSNADAKDSNVSAEKENDEGSDADSEKEEAKKDDKDKVTITYWHIFPEGDAFEPTHSELIKRFNESQDEIYVEDLGISFFDFFTKMDTAIPAGTGPDVAFYDLTDSQRRAEAGVLVDLAPYIERDNFDMSQFYDWTENTGKYNGDWYGIPMVGGGRFLVYNKDMFEEAGLDPEQPPKTIEELEEYADKLTKIKDDGSIEVLGYHPTLGNIHIRDYVYNRGNDLFDEEGNPTVNTPENVETLEWIVRMTNKYGAKQVQSLQSASSTTGIDPFLAGFVAMEGNVVDFYKKLSESDINYGVAPLPGLTEGENGSYSGAFDLEIFDHGDQERIDAAWEFVKFMASEESQQYWALQNKWPSLNQKAMESCEEMNDDPVWTVIKDVMVQAVVPGYVKGAPAWPGTIDAATETAQLEQKTPQEALDDAQKEIETTISNNAALEN